MELISYALDFASFLVQNLKELDKVQSIILFGSVARGEATKDSDIDIFIDVSDDEKKIDKNIRKISNEFFSSVKYRNYWKLLGINNEINIIAGKIERWKLKDSMLGGSILLYGDYKLKLEDGKNIVILSWGSIKPNSKRVMLNKKMFGFGHYGKRYKGLLEESQGIKLGSNVISMPAEKLGLALKIFHRFKVPVKIKRAFEYSD